jgi:hypothetical protein
MEDEDGGDGGPSASDGTGTAAPDAPSTDTGQTAQSQQSSEPSVSVAPPVAPGLAAPPRTEAVMRIDSVEIYSKRTKILASM